MIVPHFLGVWFSSPFVYVAMPWPLWLLLLLAVALRFVFLIRSSRVAR